MKKKIVLIGVVGIILIGYFVAHLNIGKSDNYLLQSLRNIIPEYDKRFYQRSGSAIQALVQNSAQKYAPVSVLVLSNSVPSVRAFI